MAKIKKIFLTKFFLGFLTIILFFVYFNQTKAATDIQAAFYVDSSYDALGRTALIATLQETGTHAYFYTEDDWFNNSSSQNNIRAFIHNLAVEFDQKIYPKLTQVYGLPWEPGIDNDPKITILISRIKEGAGGYFNSSDEFSRAQIPHSNEREMIYINASVLDSSRLDGFLAHEFQHLISFYQKDKRLGVSEDVWLNEGRSEYAATLLGYDDVFAGSNLEKRVLEFFKNPSDSLTEWGNLTNDYGSVDLFMQYLVEHFSERILTQMMQSPYVGIASINDALKTLGSQENFSNIFMDWTIANYLNDCRIAGQKYCYLNSVLSEKIKVSPSVSQWLGTNATSSLEWQDAIKDWSGHWYEFNGSDTNLKIEFRGTSGTPFEVAYLVEKSGGQNEVNFLNLEATQTGSAIVINFGTDAKSVILVPVSELKKNDFGAAEPAHQFSYKISLTQEIQNQILPQSSSFFPAPLNLADGSLIRAGGDYKVYIIKGGYKRWIQSAEIFKFYPHLGWASVIKVTPQELASYKDAWLVRADGDQKVYEINGDGTKHWLNMTAEQFSQTGRSWSMVYIINKAERDFYKTGADVMFR